MQFFSPAKINLGLHIPYKRIEDGYHQIESVFLRLDFGDTIEIEPIGPTDSSDPRTPGFRLTTNIHLSQARAQPILEVSEKGDPTQNILFKTWQTLQNIQADLPPVHVRLTKRIPPGGGLGGGSSNAACLLLYAAHLNYVSLSSIHSIAPKLGADIPFFLQDSHAWVTGIGEILEPIQVARGYGAFLVPPISLPTGEMYANLKKSLQKAHPSKTWKEQEGTVSLAVETGDWLSLRSKLFNDFETVAYGIHPPLQKIRDGFLDNGAEYSAMSGSGSTIYGLTRTLNESHRLAEAMRKQFPEHELHTFSF